MSADIRSDIKWIGDLNLEPVYGVDIPDEIFIIPDIKLIDFCSSHTNIINQVKWRISNVELQKSAIRLLSRPSVYVVHGGDIHHTGRMGLPQHMHEVSVIAEVLYRSYTSLINYISLDALVYCALLHDIGKTSFRHKDKNPTNQPDHCYYGACMIEQDLKRNSNLSNEAITHLKNIILTHHLGIFLKDEDPKRMEYEAFMIHIADVVSTSVDRVDKMFMGGYQSDLLGEKYLTSIKKLFEQ